MMNDCAEKLSFSNTVRVILNWSLYCEGRYVRLFCD